MTQRSDIKKDLILSKLKTDKYFNKQRIDSTNSFPSIKLKSKQIYTEKEHIKCYCLSDLHADNESNQQWVREYCVRKEEDQEGVYTVFILPGDIGSDLDKIRSVLSVLVKNYDAVCYVPGNHETWKKGSTGPVKYDESGHPLPLPIPTPPSNQIAEDSVEKLVEILLLAESLGVHYGPVRITSTHKSHAASASACKSESTGITSEFAATVVDDIKVESISHTATSVVVFPLYSWYHSGWDTEPDVTHSLYLQSEKMMPFGKKWSDFYMCSWPEDMISQADFTNISQDNTVLAEAFAKLNEQFLYPVPEEIVAPLPTPPLQSTIQFSPHFAHKLMTLTPLHNEHKSSKVTDKSKESSVGGDLFGAAKNVSEVPPVNKQESLSFLGMNALDFSATASASQDSDDDFLNCDVGCVKTETSTNENITVSTETASTINSEHLSASSVVSTPPKFPPELTVDIPTKPEFHTQNKPKIGSAVLGSPLVQNTDTLISFSHFLPRVELCIEKQFLMEPGLSKVIGSDILETQIRRLQPDLHLFGHTHIPMDLELEGIRSVQWPLGYKRESTTSCQMMFSTGPLLVHDTKLGNMKQGIPSHMASLDTTWAKYYHENERDTSNVNSIAPWVKARFESFGLKEEAADAASEVKSEFKYVKNDNT